MRKFLQSLFGGKSTDQELPLPPVEAMSFPEILKHVQELPDRISPQHGTALTKRLYEIALYDHHVAKEHRAGALKLLQALKTSVESVLSPDAIEAYRQANAHLESGVRRLGIGSLSWLIEEHNISPDDIISFIAKPEHRELLDDFFTVLSPADAEAVKVQLTQYRSL